jgi:hypothetical protein
MCTASIPALRTAVYDRLGLIVTRLDAREAADRVGAYAIVLHPGVRPDDDGISDGTYGELNAYPHHR